VSERHATSSSGWEVSTRPGGDVLAARAVGEGIELVLLARATGHDPAQIEAWLGELIGVAVETSRNDPGDRPISALLRHGLTGLLFSHGELWHHTPEDPPCSLAFVTTHDRVAFGWAGPAEVEIWVDGRAAEGPIIRVRDPDGREAQAIEVENWRRVRVRLEWSVASGSERAGVGVTADWAGRGAQAFSAAPPARAGDVPSALDQWRAPSWLSQSAPPPAATAAPPPPPPAPPAPSAAAPARPLAPIADARRAPQPSEPRPAEPRAARPPLDIIRPMEPAAVAPPPSDLEIVRGSEHLDPETRPEAIARRRAIPPAADPTAPAPRTAPPPLSAAELPLARPAPSTAPPTAPPPAPPAASPALQSFAVPFPEPTSDLSVVPVGSVDPDEAVSGWAPRASSRAPIGTPRAHRRAFLVESEERPPWWLRKGPIAAVTIALFAAGWILGTLPGRHDEGGGPMSRLAARIGLGPPRGRVAVDSHPQGAWIALDGRDLARRTPATIEARPGDHQITLSVANLGRASVPVHFDRDGHAAIDVSLWGSLMVTNADKSAAVKVSVDGIPHGLAPVTVDNLAPGVHQVQFWSPGAGSWDQIVEVRVRETAQLTARPFVSPATGMLEVRAASTVDGSSQAIAGALVWLDGEQRGVTPLSLELPRGPHSVRVSWSGQDSPVQLIDLPGGNQRFANFDLDASADRPRLTVQPPGRIDPLKPGVVSATLEGLSLSDVREMWLHVSTPEGTWQRYAMNVLAAPAGTVGAVVFPATQLDAHGRARYYVSVATRSGDELFTDIQIALGPAGAASASTR